MSTLNVDALVGNTSANAITVRGEGTATTSLQQGLAKAWGLFNGTGTIAIRDSHNFSSITDTAAGRITTSINANMGSVNYSLSSQSNLNDATASNSRTYNVEPAARAVGSYEIATYSTSEYEDHAYVDTSIHGDLA
tara:strand:+ start:891 stop:1298 length:408 start_codon:yes stop_codon:yes gene_type:complete